MATYNLPRYHGNSKNHLHLGLALAVPCLIGLSLTLSAAVIGSSTTPTSGSNIAISEQIEREITNTEKFSKLTRSVDVEVSDREVHLAGRVIDYNESKRIAAVAAEMAPGREVKNHLRIESYNESKSSVEKGQP